MEHLPLHLVLDVGNTRTKAGLFKAGDPLRWATFDNGDVVAITKWIGAERPAHCAVGSVAAPDPGLLAQLVQLCPVLEVSGTTPSPLRNSYSTAGTLGADRLANAVAAAAYLPGSAVLIIDAGTCITYDLVQADGTYLGGAISPGLRMRSTAMNAYSARLPMVDVLPDTPVLGTDTASSLAAGVYHGVLGEVAAFIRSYRYLIPDTRVIITGGDALWIVAGSESGIFAHPLLTLEGLHAILLYNLALDRVPGGPDATGWHGARTARQR